jgi:parallel beta-helix repeat protein
LILSLRRMAALFLMASVLQASAISGAANAATITVHSGESIRAALQIANPGDAILVERGTYHEHLNVRKPLVLLGVGDPLLDATASGSCVTLTADGTTLAGFRMINSGMWPGDGEAEAGIVVLSKNNTIYGNDASHNSNGIIISGSNNTVEGNNATGNLGFGIKVGGRDNRIFGNNLERNVKENAYDSGSNHWDNGTEGNYYGEGCTDSEGNGICDSPRPIPGGGGVDLHPLALRAAVVI